MKNQTDERRIFMNNSEKVKKILESEEVPENLLPKNIDLIIKSRRQQKIKYSGKAFRNQYIKIFSGLTAWAVFSTMGIIAIGKKAPAYEKTSESFSSSRRVIPGMNAFSSIPPRMSLLVVAQTLFIPVAE